MSISVLFIISNYIHFDLAAGVNLRSIGRSNWAVRPGASNFFNFHVLFVKTLAFLGDISVFQSRGSNSLFWSYFDFPRPKLYEQRKNRIGLINLVKACSKIYFAPVWKGNIFSRNTFFVHIFQIFKFRKRPPSCPAATLQLLLTELNYRFLSNYYSHWHEFTVRRLLQIVLETCSATHKTVGLTVPGHSMILPGTIPETTISREWSRRQEGVVPTGRSFQLGERLAGGFVNSAVRRMTFRGWRAREFKTSVMDLEMRFMLFTSNKVLEIFCTPSRCRGKALVPVPVYLSGGSRISQRQG